MNPFADDADVPAASPTLETFALDEGCVEDWAAPQALETAGHPLVRCLQMFARAHVEREFQRYQSEAGRAEAAVFLVGLSFFAAVPAAAGRVSTASAAVLLAAFAVMFCCGVADVAVCLCRRPTTIDGQHTVTRRHRRLQAFGWGVPALMGTVALLLIGSNQHCDPDDQHPRFAEQEVTCERHVSALALALVFFHSAMIRCPATVVLVATLQFALAVSSYATYPAHMDARPGDYVFRCLGYAGALVGIVALSIARDRSDRVAFEAVVRLHNSRAEIAGQRDTFRAVVRAALPSRLVHRLARLRRGADGAVPLDQLADRAEAGIVVAASTVGFGSLATGKLLRQTIEGLHTLCTFFDAALESFGLDHGGVHGDTYVATSGLGRRPCAVTALSFAWWQVNSRLPLDVPLHATVTAGEVAGAVAGSSQLRYVVGGQAVRDAVAQLPAVPADCVWADSRFLASYAGSAAAESTLLHTAFTFRLPQGEDLHAGASSRRRSRRRSEGSRRTSAGAEAGAAPLSAAEESSAGTFDEIDIGSVTSASEAGGTGGTPRVVWVEVTGPAPPEVDDPDLSLSRSVPAPRAALSSSARSSARAAPLAVAASVDVEDFAAVEFVSIPSAPAPVQTDGATRDDDAVQLDISDINVADDGAASTGRRGALISAGLSSPRHAQTTNNTPTDDDAMGDPTPRAVPPEVTVAALQVPLALAEAAAGPTLAEGFNSGTQRGGAAAYRRRRESTTSGTVRPMVAPVSPSAASVDGVGGGDAGVRETETGSRYARATPFAGCGGKFASPEDEQRFRRFHTSRMAAVIPILALHQGVVWLIVAVLSAVERAADGDVSYHDRWFHDGIAFVMLGFAAAACFALYAERLVYRYRRGREDANAGNEDVGGVNSTDESRRASGVIRRTMSVAARAVTTRYESRVLGQRHHNHTTSKGPKLSASPSAVVPPSPTGLGAPKAADANSAGPRRTPIPNRSDDVGASNNDHDKHRARRRYVRRLQAVWLLSCLGGVGALFLLRRTLVTNYAAGLYFLFAPGGAFVASSVRWPTCFACLLVLAAVFVAVDYYHLGRVAGNAVGVFVAAAWLCARATCHHERQRSVAGLALASQHAVIEANATALGDLVDRLVPVHAVGAALDALRVVSECRRHVQWGRATAEERFRFLLYEPAGRPAVQLAEGFSDFACMEVKLRVGKHAAADVAHMWATIEHAVDTASGEQRSLSLISTLGDAFLVGGPFACGDQALRHAAEACVRVLASLSATLPAAGFTAVGVIEEALGALLGDGRLRYRVYGVAPLHCATLADEAAAVQRACPPAGTRGGAGSHRGRHGSPQVTAAPARVAFLTRRFANAAGALVEAMSRPQLVTGMGTDGTLSHFSVPPSLCPLRKQRWRTHTTGVTTLFPLAFTAPSVVVSAPSVGGAPISLLSPR